MINNVETSDIHRIFQSLGFRGIFRDIDLILDRTCNLNCFNFDHYIYQDQTIYIMHDIDVVLTFNSIKINILLKCISSVAASKDILVLTCKSDPFKHVSLKIEKLIRDKLDCIINDFDIIYPTKRVVSKKHFDYYIKPFDDFIKQNPETDHDLLHDIRDCIENLLISISSNSS